MLTLIRRITFSKVGVVITMAILVLIAISFGIGGNFTGMGGGLTGDSVATVGKEDITVSELRRRTDVELQNIRQQQPTVDVVQFVNSGGVENTLEGIINSTALPSSRTCRAWSRRSSWSTAGSRAHPISRAWTASSARRSMTSSWRPAI